MRFGDPSGETLLDKLLLRSEGGDLGLRTGVGLLEGLRRELLLRA